jgi:predicted PurR-regulated permease PerM
VWKAVLVLWGGFILTFVTRWMFSRLHSLLLLLLVSLFLSLAIEPGVNRLARRGWRRGSATGLILLAVFVGGIGFVVSIGTLVGSQVADLLGNSEKYVNRVVDFSNDVFNTNIDAADVNEAIQDPDGPVQRFIRSQSDEALRLSAAVLGLLLQTLSVLLITFYLVADGPKLRRSLASRMGPGGQRRMLEVWELAITKTGGYLYSRALLASLSALFHWVAFQILGVPAPVALALWVGVISQFLPVIGTYVAGILPVLITLVNNENPLVAAVVLGYIAVYQQIENYLFAPRITARTLEMHPAVAFVSALAGAALLGPIGALLALPGAAMAQALAAELGGRHEVGEHPLTTILERPTGKRRSWSRNDRAQPP